MHLSGIELRFLICPANDVIFVHYTEYIFCSQLRQFASIHQRELGTATRAVEQALEQAEANVKWMERNYESIVRWLANVTAVAAS